MTSIYSASPVGAMIDPTKGSFTNRSECAKEHFKNNLALNTKMALAGAGGAYVAIKKPSFAVKVAKLVGEGAASIISKIGGKGVAQKIMKNPTKFGAYGLVVAGALWALNTISKHVYKAGQIDQKYTDTAAIESQTKKVVLDV